MYLSDPGVVFHCVAKQLAPKPMLVQIDVKPEISFKLHENKILGYLVQSRGIPNNVRCTVYLQNWLWLLWKEQKISHGCTIIRHSLRKLNQSSTSTPIIQCHSSGPFVSGGCRSITIGQSISFNGARGADIWGGENTKCNHCKFQPGHYGPN